MLDTPGAAVGRRYRATPNDDKAPYVAELVLRLYVAGNSASSRRAEQNLQRVLAFIKSEGWNVEIVDVLSQPELAEKAGVIATPTLSYEDAIRPRRIIGDLSDTRRVLEFLGIEIRGDLHDRTG